MRLYRAITLKLKGGLILHLSSLMSRAGLSWAKRCQKGSNPSPSASGASDNNIPKQTKA